VKRRRLRFALLATLVALVVAALALVAYGSDPNRVVSLLKDVLKRDLGLVLTYEGAPRLTYWPRLGVELDGYRIDVAATKKPLLWGDALGIEVPWRSAWSDEIVIGRIALDAPVFHATALDGWNLDARGDTTIRWPRIASGVVVRDAKYISAAIPPTVVQGVGFESSPIEAGNPLEISATWERGDDDLALSLEATPRETGEALLLDGIVLELRGGESTAHFEGNAAYGDDAAWFVTGKLDATRLPEAIARYVGIDGPAQPPTSVELRLERGDAWRAYANGSVAGVAIEADLRFTAWPDVSQPVPVLLETLRDGVEGYARAERLRIGDVVIEGFEIADDAPPTPENEATPQ
jgi:hypothetical protein